MKQRLIACFKQVFPNLSKTEILSASQDTLAEWDSVSVIALVVAIEKEFNITVDFTYIEELTSFGAFLRYLEQL